MGLLALIILLPPCLNSLGRKRRYRRLVEERRGARGG
jgi:hypothetical protein